MTELLSGFIQLWLCFVVLYLLLKFRKMKVDLNNIYEIMLDMLDDQINEAYDNIFDDLTENLEEEDGPWPDGDVLDDGDQ